MKVHEGRTSTNGRWRALGVAAVIIAPMLYSFGHAWGQALANNNDPDADGPRPWALGASPLAFNARERWRILRRIGRAHAFPLTGTDSPLAAASFGVTPVSGESAGALGSGWSAWFTGGYTRLKDVRSAWRKRGHSAAFNVGLEKALSEGLTLGLSGSFARAAQDTLYNAGHSTTRSHTITPYLSYGLSDWLTLSLSGGYVHNREKLRWTNLGAMVRGRRKSDGYTIGGALEAARWFGTVQLVARAGASANRDRWKGFTDNFGTRHAGYRETLVQATLEGGAYFWLDPVMPYVLVTYARDLKKPRQETDRDDITLTGGLSYFGTGALRPLSFDLNGAVVLGRKSQRNVSVSFGLRINF